MVQPDAGLRHRVGELGEESSDLLASRDGGTAGVVVVVS